MNEVQSKTKIGLKSFSAMSCVWRVAGMTLWMTATAASAQSGTWTNKVGGNWSASNCWSNGIVADGTGNTGTLFTANFLNVSPVTITLDTPRTIGVVQCYPNNKSVTLTGTNTLTLDNGTNQPKVRAAQAGTFNVSVVLDGTNGVITPDKGNTITFNAANSYSGDTVIESQNGAGGSGVLKVGNANAIPHGSGKGNVTLSLAGNADGSLDLNGTSLTINGLSGGGGGGYVRRLYHEQCRRNCHPHSGRRRRDQHFRWRNGCRHGRRSPGQDWLWHADVDWQQHLYRRHGD
jgi:hypothetical protein